MQTLTKELKIFKNEWPFFPFNEIKLLDKYERWRRVAKILKITKEAKKRLEMNGLTRPLKQNFLTSGICALT